MNYSEAMEYIHSRERFGMNLGLKRTERILEILGDPHKKIKCIHIAGTNGKGSITAMISNILIKEGYKVGMYTSPFLEEFEERIRINDKNISKNNLAYYVSKVKEAVEMAEEEGLGSPTEFEVITCVMYLYFYDKKVDFGVIEVGLGGRLDSTNVIIPIISIIASISYDHMNILGDTLEKIAYEKAGIIKKEIPVIVYPQEEEAKKVIKKVCEDKNSKFVEVKNDGLKLKEGIRENKTQLISFMDGEKEKNVELSLLGEHQMLNCKTAITAIEELKKLGYIVKDESIYEGLRTVKWKGRMEILKDEPTVLIDGAHNIDGIKKLKNSIGKYVKYEKITLVLGILGDKQVANMVEEICSITNNVIVVAPHSYRAEDPKKLKEEVKKYSKNVIILDDYEEAYKKALNLSDKNDLVLICGSLYMIGDMRKVIMKMQNQN